MAVLGMEMQQSSTIINCLSFASQGFCGPTLNHWPTYAAPRQQILTTCTRGECASEIAKSSKIGFRPLFFNKITAFLEKCDLSSPDHRRLFLTSSPYY